MRSIAIVGAGHAGTQLALGLQQQGYTVTLVTDRTPEEVRGGPVMSSQCMFETALDIERARGLAHWEEDAPLIEGVRFTIRDVDGEIVTTWQAPFEGAAQSVDQRLKVSVWVEQFVAAGGDLRVHHAQLSDLDALARTHDLVIVSTGKGDLGRLFPRDAEKSPFDQPRRVLALTYVTGMDARGEHDELAYSMVPGVGEYFVFRALSCSGPCDIMVFEGVPGGPMDCWEDVGTPEEHLDRSLSILREFFPDEAARCEDVVLTDEGGVLRGRLTPTVRHAVGQLHTGAHVLGMADAVVLNDPLTGQGSNHAAKAADFYLEAILRRGSDPFDAAWMRRTFEQFWRGWGQWAVQWTNSLLTDTSPHLRSLLTEVADVPGAAREIANGFDDPRLFYPWWFDETEGKRFLEQKRAQETSRFDPRELRQALGQFATGVTVVTTRGADGRRVGMTANSFTSISLDPPLVMWSPSKTAPSLPAYAAASHFAVNVLASHQHHLSRQFATGADNKFAGLEVTDGIAGVPLLPDVPASFECRTVATYDAGDHVIFIGEVERYTAPGGSPLVFHSGSYQVATKHPDV
jgi:flavin reductase (DIM6/NTAB) family NADH-FMN oxidoreductase RutF